MTGQPDDPLEACLGVEIEHPRAFASDLERVHRAARHEHERSRCCDRPDVARDELAQTVKNVEYLVVVEMKMRGHDQSLRAQLFKQC